MDPSYRSNDQDGEADGFAIGNDGCPVEMDHSPKSPQSAKDAPTSPGGRSKSKSLVASIKGAFTSEFHFESTPEYANSLKKMIIDGKDILSLTPDDINKMSLEKAKHLLSQLHIEGNLRKKGFRGFQMWKRRYFQVVGNSLMYFEVIVVLSMVYRREICAYPGNSVRSLWKERSWWKTFKVIPLPFQYSRARWIKPISLMPLAFPNVYVPFTAISCIGPMDSFYLPCDFHLSSFEYIYSPWHHSQFPYHIGCVGQGTLWGGSSCSTSSTYV